MSSDKLTLVSSDVLGRHYIASQVIQANEVVLEDISVLTFPWSWIKLIPICVGCYKELDLSAATGCIVCQWPVCADNCGNISDHAKFECKILTKNKIEFNKSAEPGLSYFCIQTLRCILLNEKYPELYEKIRTLEGHVGNRDKNPDLTETIAYVIDFIRNKCKLIQYDEATIKFALGAMEINPFLARGGIHARPLFLDAAMLAHDCVPNTSRVVTKEFDEKNKSWKFTITFKAAKLIDHGEIITTNYGDIEPNVIERRKRIKGYFFFDCGCKKCQMELKELESLAK